MNFGERFDVFVGNLTFNTTEDQLRDLCLTIGAVKHVRISVDKETGKSKGFAFVEFFDAVTALSAIKYLDGQELNMRRLKVGFPSQSNLRGIAQQLGENIQGMGGPVVNTEQALARHQQEQQAVQSVPLHEAWDIVDTMKLMLQEDRRGNKLRSFIEAHPQIINAVYELEKRLGIVLPTHILMNQPYIPGSSSAAPGVTGGGGGNSSIAPTLASFGSQQAPPQSSAGFMEFNNGNNNNMMMGRAPGGMDFSPEMMNFQQQQQQQFVQQQVYNTQMYPTDAAFFPNAAGGGQGPDGFYGDFAQGGGAPAQSTRRSRFA